MTAVRTAQVSSMIWHSCAVRKGGGIGAPKSKARKTFGARLGALLDAKGWAAGDRAARLARACRLPLRTASSYLRGERAPGLEHLQRLAQGLGIPVEQLSSGTEAPHRTPGMPQDARSPRTPRQMPTSSPSGQTAHSALTAEEIVELVTHAIAVQIRHLAEKGPHATGMWLLGAASSANHQGINDVKPLIDLARRLLNEGEESALRGDPSGMLETHSPKRTGP